MISKYCDINLNLLLFSLADTTASIIFVRSENLSSFVNAILCKLVTTILDFDDLLFFVSIYYENDFKFLLTVDFRKKGKFLC
jgi:hypothetical protein